MKRVYILLALILIGLGAWFWNVTVEIGTIGDTASEPNEENLFSPMSQEVETSGEPVSSATSPPKTSPSPVPKIPGVPATPSPERPVPASKKADVAISKFIFTPSPLTINKGATVVWTNKDDVTHTVSSDSGLFSSGAIIKGNTYSFTFEETGTFPYTCGFHLGMQGVVEVVE